MAATAGATVKRRRVEIPQNPVRALPQASDLPPHAADAQPDGQAEEREQQAQLVPLGLAALAGTSVGTQNPVDTLSQADDLPPGAADAQPDGQAEHGEQQAQLVPLGLEDAARASVGAQSLWKPYHRPMTFHQAPPMPSQTAR